MNITAYMTVREVAAYHSVHENTVRYWVYHGLIAFEMPSPRVILIPRQACEKFIRRLPGNPQIADLHKKKRRRRKR